jgi:hypothetical protein
MRPVRPGEVPKFGSVWSWRVGGTPRLALGLKKVGDHYVLVNIDLHSGGLSESVMQWTTKAFVGMGAVLDGWFCVEDAPTVDWKWQQYLDDIADSDGRLAPAGLR